MPNRDIVRAMTCLVATLCIACEGADITQLSTQPPQPLQPEEEPLRPAPSPQVVKIEGRIAFESTRDGEPWIYVTTSESLSVRRLTQGQRPAISWDGERVAFENWQAGSPPTLHVINSDGTNERVIGPGQSPAWSPDGKQIVFARYGTPSGGLYVVSADGGVPVRLLSDEFEARDHWVLSPAWSPDGRRIAFTHGGTTDWYSYADPVGIYLVNLDGSQARRLTGIPAYWEEEAAWSPDGSRLLFVSGGASWSLVSTNAAGDSARVHGTGFGPDWSPDGQLISYYRHTIPPGPEHRMRIFVTTKDGKELQLIPDAVSAHHPYSDLNASWSRKRK
jgi:TolB protein